MRSELAVTHKAVWIEALRPLGEGWPGSTRDDAFAVLPPDERLLIPDLPAPRFWVLQGEGAAPADRLPLRLLLAFAALRFKTADEHAAIRQFGLRHGPLGVRRVHARTVQGEEVYGEPISAWLDEIGEVHQTVRELRMAGAFTLAPQNHEPDEWEWFVTEGDSAGPRDKARLVANLRDRINAKLREHMLMPFTLSGAQLPLHFGPTADSLIAALWRRIAECAAGHSRIAFCVVCRQPLVYEEPLARRGRRSDARTCSDACRLQKMRDKRRATGRTARNTKPIRNVRKGGTR